MTTSTTSTSINNPNVMTIALAAISVGVFVTIGRISTSGGKKLKRAKLPPDAWLSHGSFSALEALVDTFFPAVNLSETNQEDLKQLALSLGVVADGKEGLNDVDIKRVEKFLAMSAQEYGTAKHVMNALKSCCSKTDQTTLGTVLFVLSTTFGSFLLTGYPVPFNELPLHIREKVLCGWRDSSIETFRGIYQIFKRLTSLHFMSFMSDGISNPAWDAFSYDADVSRRDVDAHLAKTGFPTKAKLLRELISYEHVAKELNATKSSTDVDHMTVDVVIIGSGSGGGMMAHCLVTAGFNVLVLEKGAYLQPEQLAHWREMDSIPASFEKGGLIMSEDGNFAVFAGSCVGGGSTINWSASFATPEWVLEDWTANGLTAFDAKNGSYQQSMNEVHKLLNVNCDHSHSQEENTNHCAVNENNRLLWHAAEKLGYTPEKVPRNVKNCVDCGHCCMGCGYNSKQSTISALMEPLIFAQANNMTKAEHGKLFIIPDCRVDKIVHNNNIAVGVTATATQYGEFVMSGAQRYARPVLGTKALQVTSKVVVCSAGSIHTPAVLLRSGFKDKYDGIGCGISLHPVIPSVAIMPRDIDTGLNRGVGMGVVVRNPPVCHRDSKLSKARQEDEQRHPSALETPPVHAAMLGTFIPWNANHGLTFKVAAMQYKHLAVFIGISRDRSQRSNHVTIDGHGEPVIKYTLNPADIPMLQSTIEAQLRHHFVSGAKVMFPTHNNFPWFIRQAGASEEGEKERFEEYLRQVRKESVKPMRAQLYTAHQMSSCRMAAKNEDGPVQPTGELYCCQNLFVADGSILPTSLGINPMITIESMSHMVSKSVVAKLKKG